MSNMSAARCLGTAQTQVRAIARIWVRSRLGRWTLVDTQQQTGFDHKLEGVDGIDRRPNCKLGNRL
jgi:hypothetical protein